jgi:hypothetical protein
MHATDTSILDQSRPVQTRAVVYKCRRNTNWFRNATEPVMANITVENSPQRYARLGGALYLAIIVLGAFAEGFVANKLVVAGDAATTASFCLWLLVKGVNIAKWKERVGT